MYQKNQITAIHFGLFVLSGEIGLGIILLPTVLAEKVGHDGWITIFLTGLIALGLTWIMMLLLQRYHDRSLYEINRLLYGKWLGQAINYILWVYLLFMAVFFLRLFSEYIRLFHLVRIPPNIVTTLIMLPTLFLTRKGYGAIGRFSYFLVVVLGVFMLLGIKASSNIRVSFLQPVGSSGWPKLLGTIPTVFYAFIGLELGAFIYADVKERKQATLWALGATITTLLFLELICLCTTGVFGEVMLKQMIAPLFNLSQYVQFPFVERVDLVFFIFWFPILESTFRAYFATAYTGLCKLARLNDSLLYYILFSIIVFSLNLLPADLNQIIRLGMVVNLAGSLVILYIAFCWGFSLLRRQERVNE
ncbi:MAG TPA: GerAB/ArcD/ProY family transporter [Bacillota bacterium]|nr:GerAB/ArcD/ProY family transporter [Bacillota bacterium]